MCTETELQPVHNADEFHLSINGFWGGRSERCFVDVHVFNLLAPSNSSSSLSSIFKKHENIKYRVYGQRTCKIEHASFIPIIMSTTGGWFMKLQFSTSIWLPYYWLSGVLNTL